MRAMIAWAKILLGNTTVVILVGFVLGLTLPGLESLPSWCVLIPLMGFIYVACSRLSFAEVRAVAPLRVGVFYLARFCVLPIVLYPVFALVLPHYKEALFLLCLAPTGVAATAWSGQWGGSTALALAYTLLGGLLGPLMIPGILAVFDLADIYLTVAPMFWTLAMVIFLPMGVYFFLTQPFYPQAQHILQAYSKTLIPLFMALIIILSMGKNRQALFADPLSFFMAVPIICGAYVLFFIFGRFFPSRNKEERITHIAASSLNNNTLMLGLSMLYFPPPVTLTLLVAGPVWNASLLMINRLFAPR